MIALVTVTDYVKKPPPPSWIKLNFDVAIREEKTYVAAIGRDQEGNLVAAWAEQLCSGSPLSGEVNAALLAIQRAADTGFKNIVIEGDAWNIIEPLRNQGSAPYWSLWWRIFCILLNVLIM